MEEVVIAGAVRTAIGRLGGTLAAIPAMELGRIVVTEALRRSRVHPQEVDQVIMGQVLQAGAGLNPARQVALRCGMPVTVTAFTVNMVCASGLKAVALAVDAIQSGRSRIVVAGGMENMSAALFISMSARWGARLGHSELKDTILTDALEDPIEGCHMGVTAEGLAERFGIGREEQDRFAVSSHQNAAEAIRSGLFKHEIAPVLVEQKKGHAISFDTDEFCRPDTNVEALAGLKPVFKTGVTVTAGNASGINDGAAAAVLLSRTEAEARGIRPMARVIAHEAAGVPPLQMGLGPVPATRGCLARAKLHLKDIDVIELNEAFAGQALAVIKQLGLDTTRLNLRGGAIALGHPVGASGARILVTLIHIMEQEGARHGLATLCVGGGQGMAIIVARDD